MAEPGHRSPASGDGFGAWLDADLRPVAIVLHDTTMNGASIAAIRAVPHLNQLGWRHCFWVPAPGPAFDWLRERGAEVHGRPKPVHPSLRAMRQGPGLIRNVAASPGYLRSFVRFLTETDPELVHANSLFTFSEALLAHAMRRATMAHIHDLPPADRRIHVARLLCRRGVDEAIAVSDACAAFYSTSAWRPQVVYESTPIPDAPVEARVEPSPFVVGTVGVVAPRKGSDTFVEVASRLLGSQAGRGLEMHMVGAPDDRLTRDWGEAVIRSARAAGIHYRPRADVLGLMRGWDAFVLPSIDDPCPLVVLEAMALGIPVIASRSGGIPEQLTEDCGILVEPRDVAGFADAIARIARMDPAARAAMGQAGRRRARAMFGIERQADGLAAAYERALASRGHQVRR